MEVQWFELEVVYLEEDKFSMQFQYSIIMKVNEPHSEKIFNFEDRLVRFAGESILFVRKLERTYELEYYKNQLIRSSGSSS